MRPQPVQEASPVPVGDHYTHTAVALHWLMAVLIAAGFALGWVMTDIPGFTPAKLKYFSWHKWIGVTVLWLAVIRVLWRATHPAPALPATMRGWERLAAHGGHALLYVLLFAVPVSGYLFSSAAGMPVVYLGVLPLPTVIAPDPYWKAVLLRTHVTLDWILVAAVAGHLLAVLKHELIDKSRILPRMLPWSR
jgi:cytochrome b561